MAAGAALGWRRRRIVPGAPALMILYEDAASPALRPGEHDLGGRRVSVRAFSCLGEIGHPRYRFDPVERRFVARRASGTVSAGPAAPAAWTSAFARLPDGPVAVEGASREEEVRGSYLAAAAGAFDAGRGAYLLDPPDAGLPAAPGTRAGEAPPRVAIFTWRPGQALDPAAISAARLRDIPCGVAWPVIPGWTAEEEVFGPWLEEARAAGATFALALAPPGTPEFRRHAVEARACVDPAAAEAFFDVMHHTPWDSAVAAGLQSAADEVRRLGLSPMPPRPAAPSEPVGNWRAASRLEEAASRCPDEHRAARLHAAVRWIDGCGRDLGAIHREGNFSRAFPFGPELAREAESALSEAPE
ncbi:MAG: hypothetical protein ABI682_09395 [Acidobacteriota bacterium]